MNKYNNNKNEKIVKDKNNPNIIYRVTDTDISSSSDEDDVNQNPNLKNINLSSSYKFMSPPKPDFNYNNNNNYQSSIDGNFSYNPRLRNKQNRTFHFTQEDDENIIKPYYDEVENLPSTYWLRRELFTFLSIQSYPLYEFIGLFCAAKGGEPLPEPKDYIKIFPHEFAEKSQNHVHIDFFRKYKNNSYNFYDFLKEMITIFDKKGLTITEKQVEKIVLKFLNSEEFLERMEQFKREEETITLTNINNKNLRIGGEHSTKVKVEPKRAVKKFLKPKQMKELKPSQELGWIILHPTIKYAMISAKNKINLTVHKDFTTEELAFSEETQSTFADFVALQLSVGTSGNTYVKKHMDPMNRNCYVTNIKSGRTGNQINENTTNGLIQMDIFRRTERVYEAKGTKLIVRDGKKRTGSFLISDDDRRQKKKKISFQKTSQEGMGGNIGNNIIFTGFT